MRRTIVLALFVGSGACSLVYELLWMRYLALTVGGGALAVATVLTAFMAGLAFGSVVGGAWADSVRRPLRVYGFLELGIAAYAVAFPWLLAAIEPLLGPLYRATIDAPGLRGLALLCVGGGLLLPPTAAMGATLPLLLREVGDAWTAGRSSGRLYAANTTGAVLGILGAGFVLLPGLGLARSLWLTAAVNAVLGLAAIVIGRTVAPPPERPPARRQWTPGLPPMVLTGAFFATGLVAMTHQVCWTRAIAMSIGSTTYAFSLIVALFVGGLAIGGALGSVLVVRSSQPDWWVAPTLVATGVAGMLTTWSLGQLPLWIIERVGSGSHLTALARVAGILVLVVLPSTIASGVLLPLVYSALRPREVALGRTLGRLVAWNTAGTIVGIGLATFVMMPQLGVEMTSRRAALLIAALGFAIHLINAPRGDFRRGRAPAIATGLVVLGLIHTIPRWDRDVVSSAVYLYGPRYRASAERQKIPIAEAIRREGQTVFYRDGAAATVLVKRTGRELALLINGKADASTSGDMRTQQLLAHLPMLFAPSRKRVLVIGLGSGITLGAIRGYREAEQVDAVEISPGVIEAAAGPFRPYNDDALRPADGFRAIATDARAHVRLSGRTFDVVSSEPSNPWIAGIANLYTRECFEALRDSLSEGAVVAQWLQAYRMGLDDWKLVARTFTDVFPHAALFKTQLADNPRSGDFILLGSTRPLTLDWPGYLARWRSDEGLRQRMERAGIYQPGALLDGFLLDGDGLRALAGDGPRNTDDGAALEFSAPKALYQSATGPLLSAISPTPLSTIVGGALTDDDRARIAEHDAARTALLSAIAAIRGGKPDRALMRLEFALGKSPRVDELRVLAFDLAHAFARAAPDARRPAALRRARALLGNRASVLRRNGQAGIALELAAHALRRGDAGGALTELKQATVLAPRNPRAWRLLGEAQVASGRHGAARSSLGRARELGGAPGKLALAWARLARATDDEATARAEVARARALGVEVPADLRDLLD